MLTKLRHIECNTNRNKICQKWPSLLSIYIYITDLNAVGPAQKSEGGKRVLQVDFSPGNDSKGVNIFRKIAEWKQMSKNNPYGWDGWEPKGLQEDHDERTNISCPFRLRDETALLFPRRRKRSPARDLGCFHPLAQQGQNHNLGCFRVNLSDHYPRRGTQTKGFFLGETQAVLFRAPRTKWIDISSMSIWPF